MDEVKINTRNLIIGCIVMIACIYVGAVSTIPHRTVIITTAINLPAQLITQVTASGETVDTVSEYSVATALNTSNAGVLNSLNVGRLIELIIIIGIATIVFILLSTTGLIPRFGGMS